MLRRTILTRLVDKEKGRQLLDFANIVRESLAPFECVSASWKLIPPPLCDIFY